MEDTTNGIETTESTEAQESQQTFTLEEVTALIQSEADKRVTQALKKQQKKHEQEMSLSKLDDDKRAVEEKALRIAELEEQLAAFKVEANRSELKSVLSARGLSAEFADIINISDDLEESQANIDALDKLFKAAVRKEVETRLAATGGTPKGAGTSASGEMTKERFKKLGVAAQQAFKNANPEEYKKILQQS